MAGKHPNPSMKVYSEFYVIPEESSAAFVAFVEAMAKDHGLDVKLERL